MRDRRDEQERGDQRSDPHPEQLIRDGNELVGDTVHPQANQLVTGSENELASARIASAWVRWRTESPMFQRRRPRSALGVGALWGGSEWS